MINSFVLENANYVVQTDTGVPYHFFQKGWTTSLFGKYIWPTTPFEGSFRQQDLMNDFDNGKNYVPLKTKTLPFAYCYHINTSHLMYFEREEKVAETVDE